MHLSSLPCVSIQVIGLMITFTVFNTRRKENQRHTSYRHQSLGYVANEDVWINYELKIWLLCDKRQKLWWGKKRICTQISNVSFRFVQSLILDSFLFLAQGNTKRLNSTLMPPSYIIFKSTVSNILPIHVVY